jgi:deoxyribose-phosphate aldolase
MHTNLASRIDHTLLKPEAGEENIKKLCHEAVEFGFASVCVHPCYVSLAEKYVKDTAVKVCTVIGFPLGANHTAIKAMEAAQAAKDGAEELDMVLNVGALKSGLDEYVKADIKAVVDAVPNKIVKVILETALLTNEEKRRACSLAKEAGAHFVKTSTGFGPGGATVEDIRLMRDVVGPDFGVKASGGIRNYEDAVKMIQAGATRIGTSAGPSIIKGIQNAAPQGNAY